jgi:hypothetical protein
VPTRCKPRGTLRRPWITRACLGVIGAFAQTRSAPSLLERQRCHVLVYTRVSMQAGCAGATGREQEGSEAYCRGVGNSSLGWLWLYYNGLRVTGSFCQPITVLTGYKDVRGIGAFCGASAMDGIDSLYRRTTI